MLIDVLFHASINSAFNVFLPIVYPEAAARLIEQLGFVELALIWAVVLLLVAIYGRSLKRQPIHTLKSSIITS